MTRHFPYNVDVSSRYGAPIGRGDEGDQTDDAIRFSYRRVPMHDGDYDGGAYWGGGRDIEPLFCAWTRDRSVIRYMRAKSSAAFETKMRDEFPLAVFR